MNNNLFVISPLCFFLSIRKKIKFYFFENIFLYLVLSLAFKNKKVLKPTPKLAEESTITTNECHTNQSNFFNPLNQIIKFLYVRGKIS